MNQRHIGSSLVIASALLVVRPLFGAEQPTTPVVALPPMVVEEKAALPPWLYVAVDGAEYLSRCSAETTRGYAEMRRSRLQWLHALFPPEFFARMDVPMLTVLVSQRLKPGNNAEVIGEVVAAQPDADDRGFVRATTAPNMMLDDSDGIGVFAYVAEAAFDRRKLTLSTDYVRLLLERRTPRLPRWLREGMISVYNDVHFPERAITLRPLAWFSAAEARALKRDANAPRTLLPVAELFDDSFLGEGSTPRDEVARVQRTLLIRWALDPRHGVRDAFWRFAARAAEEPANEAMFTACFGFGYADLRDRLADYVPEAIREPLHIPPGALAGGKAPEVRPATPSEIARLRGEWERLAVPFVRRRFPEHATRYLEQARQTLRRAHDAGDRDPRLITSLGLCELDAGNAAEARVLLEDAINRGVVRPRAYYEVARLHWAGLAPRARSPDGLLAAEIVPVIGPLRRGFAQAPLLPEACELFADAWLACTAAPGDDDVKAMVRHTRLHAAESHVALRAARALARHGRTGDAVAVLGAAFVHVRDEPTRKQFAQLYALISKRR